MNTKYLLLYSIFTLSTLAVHSITLESEKMFEDIRKSLFLKIVPGETDLNQVSDLIGKPIQILDLKPSGPGPVTVENATQPLLEYEMKGNWQVLIYAMKSDFKLLLQHDHLLKNKVGMIVFVPKVNMKVNFDTSTTLNERVNGSDLYCIGRIDNRFQVVITGSKSINDKRIIGYLKNISVFPEEKYRRNADGK